MSFSGKFTVAEYHRMIAEGVLTENDPVEHCSRRAQADPGVACTDRLEEQND